MSEFSVFIGLSCDGLGGQALRVMGRQSLDPLVVLSPLGPIVSSPKGKWIGVMTDNSVLFPVNSLPHRDNKG